ncbi:MAG: hypothetical protein JWP97_593, partial [Labilithrix sp.]|nr:hypothetical protein [Labilithrix sp.]
MSRLPSIVARLPWLAPALVALAPLVACGSDDGSGAVTGTETTTGAPSTPSAPAPAPAPTGTTPAP